MREIQLPAFVGYGVCCNKDCPVSEVTNLVYCVDPRHPRVDCGQCGWTLPVESVLPLQMAVYSQLMGLPLASRSWINVNVSRTYSRSFIDVEREFSQDRSAWCDYRLIDPVDRESDEAETIDSTRKLDHREVDQTSGLYLCMFYCRNHRVKLIGGHKAVRQECCIQIGDRESRIRCLIDKTGSRHPDTRTHRLIYVGRLVWPTAKFLSGRLLDRSNRENFGRREAVPD